MYNPVLSDVQPGPVYVYLRMYVPTYLTSSATYYIVGCSMRGLLSLVCAFVSSCLCSAPDFPQKSAQHHVLSHSVHTSVLLCSFLVSAEAPRRIVWDRWAFTWSAIGWLPFVILSFWLQLYPLPPSHLLGSPRVPGRSFKISKVCDLELCNTRSTCSHLGSAS